MNKSLAFKNKLYLFLSLIFSLFIFLYLSYFLIYAERGVISYFILKNKQVELEIKLNEVTLKNDFLLDKVLRLKPNTIDLDYLDEQFRRKTGFIDKNEIAIVLK